MCEGLRDGGSIGKRRAGQRMGWPPQRCAFHPSRYPFQLPACFAQAGGRLGVIRQ